MSKMTAPTDPKAKPARITGIAHFFAAAGYSLGGLRRLMKESAFRHELVAVAVFLGLLLILGASAAELFCFGVLTMILIATEALNTALECIVDHLSPGWSEFARDAKDLGSLAVMCVLIGHGLLLAYVVLF
jgi:diacylglycerol kinase (ATP)